MRVTTRAKVYYVGWAVGKGYACFGNEREGDTHSLTLGRVKGGRDKRGDYCRHISFIHTSSLSLMDDGALLLLLYPPVRISQREGNFNFTPSHLGRGFLPFSPSPFSLPVLDYCNRLCASRPDASSSLSLPSLPFK